ncbi:hypothetical protein ACFFSH_34255 [Streptomyces filamentosus]|nr:hypothetical protein [Streptomyces filamentosus]
MRGAGAGVGAGDKTFGDARLCAAIADRITFRCTLIRTGTEPYRYQTTQ